MTAARQRTVKLSIVQAGDAASSWCGTRRPATATTLSSKQMAADNHTTIVGNLVDDPELRFTYTGIAAGHRPLA